MSDGVWLSAGDLTVFDLAPLGPRPATSAVAALRDRASEIDQVLVARCELGQIDTVRPIAEACTMTLVAADQDEHLPAPYVAVPNVDAAVTTITDALDNSPKAAAVLNGLLRSSGDLDVRSGLYAESAAYSMLLAGPEFARWLAARPVTPPIDPTEPVVCVARDNDVLTVTLNRPDRHNAFGRWMRDAACDALDIARLDPSIQAVQLRGTGPSFCSGGDLDEFGTQPDVVLAHLIRLDRSVGWRLHQLAARTTVHVHGACVGAGIELPAFAGRVAARPDAWFELPELRMGLIPGAGGTVSLPRRIGRWRTAWLAMSGTRIDVATAHRWGLVDDCGD